jgi:hypothetical protein
VTVAVIACVGYVGSSVGKVYWRFYQYQDDMRQEIKFASKSTNDQILFHMRADADSLGMPDDARAINIFRDQTGIKIDAEYTETLKFPLYTRDIKFRPHAEGPI